MEALTNPRLLDAEVAEKVMGLRIVSHKWPCGHHPDGDYKAAHFPGNQRWWAKDEGPVYVPECGEWPPDDEGYAMVAPVPFYSTEIAAAFEVVEKLIDVDGPYGEHKWSFGLEYSTVVDWVADFTPRRNHPKSREYPAYQAQAGSTALAICLAALKAIGAR